MKTLNQIFTSFFLILGILMASCNQSDGYTETIETTDTTSTPEATIAEGPIAINVKSLNNVNLNTSSNYKNLQVFMITGTAEADNLNYVTLKEAMDNKWVEIKETSDVNELEINNLSDKIIFINAGDIVRGGKQDRTLTYDMIIGPHAKREKLSSFCVESGRWAKRGSENVDAFESNEKILTSRKLKIASKKYNNQGEVWKSVEEQQNKLSGNVSHYSKKAVNVKSEDSESSLELALDNEDLNKMKTEYKKHFSKLYHEEAIGFAYAVNGELYTVDIYNNKKLFKDLFNKLLDAAIIEAIGDLDTTIKDHQYLSIADVNHKLNLKEDSKTNMKDLNTRTRWNEEEDEDIVYFTSSDRKNDLIWVHTNIIVKDKTQTETSRLNLENIQSIDNMLNNDAVQQQR